MNSDGKFSRRDFLKLSALAAGALALSPMLQFEKPLLRDLAARLNMDVGAAIQEIDRWKFYDYPEYTQSLLQFSMLKDGMAEWPDMWFDQIYAYEYLTQLGRFAKKHDMRFSLDILFHARPFDKNSKLVYLNTASQADLEVWMQERVRKFFEVPYFTDLQFANETMSASEVDPVTWNTNGPMYRAYGKEWPAVAYGLAWEEAVKTGRKVGENLTLVYHTGGLVEVPNSDHANADYAYLSTLKKQLSDKYGLARPFAIGLEYHVHTGKLPYFNGCWGPGSYQLKKEALIEHFQRFAELGDVYVNEFSVAGTDDPGLKKEVLHTVLEAAIESKACKRFLVFQPFTHDTGDKQSDAYQRTCVTQNMFDENLKPDTMFNEMYSIFEHYATSL